jgi:hypothetical protein
MFTGERLGADDGVDQTGNVCKWWNCEGSGTMGLSSVSNREEVIGR